MKKLVLSMKKIFNYQATTKQKYNLNQNTNITYSNPNYFFKKQAAFVDIILAERFKKSQDMIVVCAQIEVSLRENSFVPQELLQELEEQLTTFERLDLPVVKYIEKNIINHEIIKPMLLDNKLELNASSDALNDLPVDRRDAIIKARENMTHLGYIERAFNMAKDTFEQINNQNGMFLLSKSQQLQYAS